jgi:hypothetical protein
MDVAKQLLGDKSDEAKVYAVRHASALTEVALKQWEKAERLFAIVRKSNPRNKKPRR